MKKLLAALICTALGTAGAHAEIVFSDDFEAGTNAFGGNTPDVSGGYNNANFGSSQFNTTLWVEANQGFGSGRNGLIAEGASSSTDLKISGVTVGTTTYTEQFIDPVGNQALSFRYTNSGATTTQGLLGTLSAGQTIIVTFDVVINNIERFDDYDDATPDETTYASGTAYNVGLVTFDLETPLGRNDVRNNANSTGILAQLTGDLEADYDPEPVPVTYTTVSFSYVVTGSETQLGDDIAVRIFGQTSHANIDNLVVEIVPEPGSLALLGLGGLLIGYRRRR